MICDFNVPYEGEFHGLGRSASLGVRANLAAVHTVNIFVKTAQTIIELAKLIIFTVLAAIFVGQSKYMNEAVILSAFRLNHTAIAAGISVLGFFAPLNALKWRDQNQESFEDRCLKSNHKITQEVLIKLQ